MKSKAALVIGLFGGVALVLAVFVTAVYGRNEAGKRRGQDLRLLNQLGGVSIGVDQQGDYAYVGVGPRLVIMDVTNPAAATVPRKTGRTCVVEVSVTPSRDGLTLSGVALLIRLITR